MTDTLKAIRDTYRNLDINSMESELLAQEEIDAMSGDGDETDPSALNVPDVMPLPDAISLVTDSLTQGFQIMRDIAERRLEDFSRKAEDMKATQDSRTLYANMALGVKKVLLEWGSRIAEAKERLERTSPDERQKIGNLDQLLHEEAAPVDERPVGTPSASVMENTKRAQEWFKSNAQRN